MRTFGPPSSPRLCEENADWLIKDLPLVVFVFGMIRLMLSFAATSPIMRIVSGTATAENTQNLSASGAKLPCIPSIAATVEKGRKNDATAVIKATA